MEDVTLHCQICTEIALVLKREKKRAEILIQNMHRADADLTPTTVNQD